MLQTSLRFGIDWYPANLDWTGKSDLPIFFSLACNIFSFSLAKSVIYGANNLGIFHIASLADMPFTNVV